MKRPYEQLGPTQQWKRRKAAAAAVTAVLQRQSVPDRAIQPRVTFSSTHVLITLIAERDRECIILHAHMACG